MVRLALEKRGRHTHSYVHYFIADAENIPIRSGLIDIAVFRGFSIIWKIPTL
jgi:hypothetical protein